LVFSLRCILRVSDRSGSQVSLFHQLSELIVHRQFLRFLAGGYPAIQAIERRIHDVVDELAASRGTEKSRHKIESAVSSLENIQVSDLMKVLSTLEAATWQERSGLPTNELPNTSIIGRTQTQQQIGDWRKSGSAASVRGNTWLTDCFHAHSQSPMDGTKQNN